jgi:fatty acid-binding protein DegV
MDTPDPQYSGAIIHGDAPALADALQEEFKYLLSPQKTLRISLGAVLGTHTGPKAQGLTYITKGRS